jgi:cell division protease FtsH
MSDGFNDPKKDKNKDEWPQFPFGGKLPDFKPFGGWKSSIIYIIILIIVMSLFNFVFLRKVTPTIDFSEFKARIETGEIIRVELGETYFTGYTTLPSPRRETSPGPFHRTYSSPPGPIYRTVPIYDSELIKFMDEKGIAYYADSRQGSAILNIIFSWVLPIAFLLLIWRFFLKRLGNMGGNVLSVGQNRAVIVAEGDIATRFNDVAGVDEAKEELVEVVDF